MIKYLIILLFPLSLLSQKNISPSFIHSFELHPDSIQKQRDLKHLVDSLYRLENKSDSIKEFLNRQDLEILEIDDPFYIGPIGCSWYCGGGPRKINSNTNSDTIYKDKKIHDFDLKTSWNGKVEENEITFYFRLGKTLRMTEIIIYSGKHSSLKDWQDYARPKQIELSINDSTFIHLNLSNSYHGQGFELKNILPKDQTKMNLKFRVLSVHPGRKEKSVFHISEINFNGVGDH